MRQEIVLTPLNAGYGEEINSFHTWDPAAHGAAGVRSLLFKDPFQSWFSLKAVTEVPYLEPAFFGLRDGDIVRVSFEAMLKSGSGSVNVNLVPINPDYSLGTEQANLIPDASMASHFNYFEVPLHVRYASLEQVGAVLRIQPSEPGSEIVLRSVRVAVESRNTAFKLRDQIVQYATVDDYLAVINGYSGTSLNPDYAGLQSLLDGGKIAFPDDQTVEFAAPAGTFAGLFALLKDGKYRPAVTVFAEYQNLRESGIASAVRWYRGGEIAAERSKEWPAGADQAAADRAAAADEAAGGASFRKASLVFAGREGFGSVVADVGSNEAGAHFRLKRFVVSLPRFDDDQTPAAPNRLEDLYPDLARRLALVARPELKGSR